MFSVSFFYPPGVSRSPQHKGEYIYQKFWRRLEQTVCINKSELFAVTVNNAIYSMLFVKLTLGTLVM